MKTLYFPIVIFILGIDFNISVNIFYPVIWKKSKNKKEKTKDNKEEAN